MGRYNVSVTMTVLRDHLRHIRYDVAVQYLRCTRTRLQSSDTIIRRSYQLGYRGTSLIMMFIRFPVLRAEQYGGPHFTNGR